MLVGVLAVLTLGGAALARFVADDEDLATEAPTPTLPVAARILTAAVPPPAPGAEPAAKPSPAASLALTQAAAQRAPSPSAGTQAAEPASAYSWDRSGTLAKHDPELAAALEVALQGVTGDVSLAVRDLGSGRGAMLNPNLELPSASIFKSYVLYSVLAAGLPMGEQLEITDRIKEYDLGTLELEVGESMSVAEALERMVTISDNSSAILLADRVGATNINSNLRKLGLTNTFYLTDRLNTSAGDMLKLLSLMAEGDAVSPSASGEMIHLLLRQRVNDRIPLLLPKGVRVAHKTGNLPGVVSDVGVIYGEHSTVVVSVLISETSNDGVAARAIARVAEAAYEHYEALGVAGPRIPPQPARAIPPTFRDASQRTPTPVPAPSPSAVAVKPGARS